MNACEQLQPGYKLGDYTIERLLGKGGMGAVYLVHDASGALFAAKAMMRFDKDNQNEWHKRFLKEASFAITVHHKNLVAVHDAGEDHGTGICYIIMDYIPGGSLSDLLESKGRLDVREAVDIVIAIASALEVAHGLDIVHRDIKPENILFDTDGTPKLADMGIAKFSGPSGSTLTSTGMIIGTPAYMSPEQMMNSHMVDPRSDIYSLGLVLYEMLTGMRPHANSTVVELIAKAIKGEELPDIRTIRPEVSVAVAYVLSLMVAVKPENRPASAKETAKLLLDAATSRLTVKCSQIKKDVTDSRNHRSPRSIAAWALVSIALFSALIAIGWWLAKDTRIEPQSPKDPAIDKGNGEKTQVKPKDPAIDKGNGEKPQVKPKDPAIDKGNGEKPQVKPKGPVIDKGNSEKKSTDSEQVKRAAALADKARYLYKAQEYYRVVSLFYEAKMLGHKLTHEDFKILKDAYKKASSSLENMTKEATQDVPINASITASEGQPRYTHRRPASRYNYSFSPGGFTSYSAKKSNDEFVSRKSWNQNSRNEATLLKGKLDAMYRQLTDHIPPDFTF